MSTDLNALFNAMHRGDTRAITEQLFSQGPQQPMPGHPALVERPSPCDDAGTASVVDLCECGGSGEVEKNIDGCDVMVECIFCTPQPAPRFRSRDEYEAYEAGVPARGEI